MYSKSLLTVSNLKLSKSDNYGYLSVGLHLAPHRLGDGSTNLCKFSTKSCRETCLYSAGKGGLTKIQESRIKKTQYFLNNTDDFIRQLDAEIFYYKQLAKIRNKQLTVRLNLTSDINWQEYYYPNTDKTLFEIHKDIVFVDYTKDYNRVSLFDNYHLVYSYDSINHSKAIAVLERGERLAVVFKSKGKFKLPETFYNYLVVNGDDNDLIHLKPKKTVLGLKYKNIISPGINNNEILKKSTLVVHI